MTRRSNDIGHLYRETSVLDTCKWQFNMQIASNSHDGHLPSNEMQRGVGPAVRILPVELDDPYITTPVFRIGSIHSADPYGGDFPIFWGSKRLGDIPPAIAQSANFFIKDLS